MGSRSRYPLPLVSADPARPRLSLAARVSDRATVVEVPDRLYLRVDAEGRWTAFAEGGVLFRRTVDGLVLRPRGRGFETCTDAEADSVHGWVVRRAGELIEALAESDPSDVGILGDEATLLARLRRTACSPVGADPRTARAEFARAYPEPVPILPPHRYRDLVVLPATGCPNHRCGFCAFYRDRPFRVLDRDAFRAHLDAVQRLFGAALYERDGVFLGSASALSIPDPALAERLDDIAHRLGRPRRGIASFHDPDRSPRRRARDWAELVAAGLVEATLGLETGLPSLRRAAGKSDDLVRFEATVEEQKAGGLRLSVTLLVGLGGPDAARMHRLRTIERVARLALGTEDYVYLSPLQGTGSRPWLAEELARWRSDLPPSTKARVGEYRIDRFAWFA